MTKTLTLLVASTALTAATCVPGWSAMDTRFDGPRPVAALLDDATRAAPLILASAEDADDNDRWQGGARRGHDDDDDDDNDDCDDSDDDDDCRGSTRSPAPAGTVAPPQNGLFGNGAPPKVRVN